MTVVYQDTTVKIASVTQRVDEGGTTYTIVGPTLLSDQGNETELVLVSDVADSMLLAPGDSYTLTIEEEPGSATGTVEVTGVAPTSIYQDKAFHVVSGIPIALTEFRSGETVLRVNHGSSPSPFPVPFDMNATYKITIG